MNDYWIFFADRTGYIPMGSDGQMKVPFSTVRNLRKLTALATSFRAGRAGRVYLMSHWTQAMSELGPRAFEEYIQKYGTVIEHS